jgi:serine/threonine protein kinase
MIYGTPPKREEPTYMMALEYADTDIEKMILNTGKAETSLLCNDKVTVCSLVYSQELALDLALQISSGMAYMVAEGHGHFDLKPENVLVANDGSSESPQWVAKVADFGMSAAEDAVTGAAAAGGNDAEGSQSVKAPAWTGTYLYMAPVRLDPPTCNSNTSSRWIASHCPPLHRDVSRFHSHVRTCMRAIHRKRQG